MRAIQINTETVPMLLNLDCVKGTDVDNFNNFLGKDYFLVDGYIDDQGNVADLWVALPRDYIEKHFSTMYDSAQDYPTKAWIEMVWKPEFEVFDEPIVLIYDRTGGHHDGELIVWKDVDPDEKILQRAAEKYDGVYIYSYAYLVPA